MTELFTARNKVAIAGYAQSPIRRHADETLGALTIETARLAVADAGLTVEDIDGFVTASLFPTAGAHAVEDGVSIVSANWLAAHLGVDPGYAAGFQGLGQLPGAVSMAVNAVASGAARHVLVHRALHNPQGRYHGNSLREARGSEQWTVPQGFFGPLATIALTANEYLEKYGASRTSMAAVVTEARRNGASIPWSYWNGRPLSEREYLDAPMINDPICRLDCDIPVDGAAAFVFTSADRARDLPNRPVYVAGYANGSPVRHRLPLHWPLDDLMEVGVGTAHRLFERAAVRSDEIDLPQLYDGFSPFVFFWMEALGLCPIGEAHRLVEEGGIDSRKPDAIPALSGGGALGNGRMHGVPQMLECYLQLSGRAGERQREATIGVACHSSPHLGGAVVYTAEPFR
ncbi:MAG: thiolase family protein [Acidimicrobiales bacterium]